MTVTMSTATMTRLDSQHQDNERSVTFVLAFEDTGMVYRTLLLSYGDWKNLGSPDEITAVVTPGPIQE